MSQPEQGVEEQGLEESSVGRPRAVAAAVVRASALAGARQRRLTGWGRTAPSTALVVAPRSVEEVAETFAAARAAGGLIARGAGRSYGDAAQNGGGVVADLRGLRDLEILDEQIPAALNGRRAASNRRHAAIGASALVRAGAGATLAEAMQALASRGLRLPVVPGTRHITIGGAIAADIHGKNHRRDGSFAHHVHSIMLCLPDGSLRELSREREADLFHATVGGMGLTGVIVEAVLRTEPAGAALLDGDIDRTTTLEQALSVMEPDEGHRYAIAWVDLLSGGSAFGRSVVLRSNDRPLRDPEHGGIARAGVRMPGRPRLAVPEGFPEWALRAGAVRAFNTLRWRRAPGWARGVPITAGANFFPLDALGEWNRLYGRSGLIQYQCAVPEARPDALLAVVHRLRAASQPMYLAVVKRFGEGSGGLLSFPQRGWTLAVDLPAASVGLGAALDAADELVAEAGGRVYLAKDARLRGEALAAMYPQLRRFEEIRAAVDPDGVLRSDMATRLGLAAESGR